MDRIRAATGEDEQFEEFYWFAREYPRCYRFHLDAADYRLQSIHSLMQEIHTELASEAANRGSACFGISMADRRTSRIYWDFESLLSEINISLDLLARVVGPAFPQQTPPSFNRLCKLGIEHPVLSILRAAKGGWVDRLKDYRDCFTHYTPVDTILMVELGPAKDCWELRAKLPINPNVREILGFRYSRRVELLRYSIATHRRLSALDRAVASTIWRLYREGEFPRRTTNLFFVGRRCRAPALVPDS